MHVTEYFAKWTMIIKFLRVTLFHVFYIVCNKIAYVYISSLGSNELNFKH